MVTIIKNEGFVKVADGVKPDSKNSVTVRVTSLQEGVTYHIHRNSIGQIILDRRLQFLFRNAGYLTTGKRLPP